MLKPVSLFELSFQLRLTCELEVPVAIRFDGADGVLFSIPIR
jgi:hypothetical protein